MSDVDELFPKLQKSIENLIEDEEGNIPGKKLLVLGTMMVVLSSLLAMDVFAGHRSHSSHTSHGSHSSGSSGHGNHGSHESHVSHSSHSSGSSHSSHGSHSNTHSSHASHTSHSNTAVHSNSSYSSEGDVSYNAPAASTVPGIKTPTVSSTEDMFKLPTVNQNIELPNGTPASSILPTLAVPASSAGTKMDMGGLHEPSATDKVE